MSRFTTAILPLAVPASVGAIILSSAGRWDLRFVWAIIAVLAAFYLALALFADPGIGKTLILPSRSSTSITPLRRWPLLRRSAGRNRPQ